MVKGWQYVRTGIYWCARAFDKGAKGGKVFGVDIDEWREGGKAGLGWNINLTVPAVHEESEAGSSDAEASGSEASGDGEDSETGSEREGEGEGETIGAAEKIRGKRKNRTGRLKSGKSVKRAKIKATTKPIKGKTKRLPHPKSSSSYLPLSVPSLEDLPTDPYERALRLLHVGATPESLPCREEEFIDVLSKVEEGVETGGGGCLCTFFRVCETSWQKKLKRRYRGCPRYRQDGDGPRRGQGAEAESGGWSEPVLAPQVGSDKQELPPFSYVEINGLKIPSPQHAYTVLWEAISGAKGVSSKTALRGLESHFGQKTMGVRGPRNNT